MIPLPRLFVLFLFLAGAVAAPALASPGIPDLKPPQDSITATLDSVVVEYIPVEPDELIQDRLSCMEKEIPLHFNKYVRGYVDYFTIRNRTYTRRVLSRENLYFPLFEKYLKQYNLPGELKYLSVVESALLPKAVSRAKAVGLWQFMPVTARDFRLRQDEFIDERMDPEKSTEAACKYLRQLYRIFGDWELAMAAYNYGPGNVNKAIRRSGKKNPGFWDIYAYLPGETRNYVPTFAALIYTMNYAPEHNIFADSLQFPVLTDTVLVNHSLDLERFAAQLNLHPDELLRLNPAVRKTYLPESTKNYPLKVPAEKRELLALNRVAIFDSSRVQVPVKQPKAPVVLVAGKETPAEPADSTAQATAKTEADSLRETVYVVQRGDNLLRIARAHEVSVEELKEWNQLKGSTIQPNQKLTVRLPAPAAPAGEESDASQETAVAQATAEPTQVVAAKPAPAPAKKAAPAPKKQLPKIHSVQPGDTLWDISRRYEGLTVEQLKKVNKLKTNKLKPGQKLVVGFSS